MSYGYVGVFGISLLSGFVIFVPVPYVIPVALVSLEPRFDPSLVALAAAAGQTLSKTLVFRASYLGRKFVGEATARRVRPFEKLVARYGWLAAFLASATPMPDDVVYIPLGFARYNMWKFILATFIGKTLLAAAIAWGARMVGLTYIGWLIEPSTNVLAAAASGVALATATALSVYAILKLDWGKLLARWFPWTVTNDTEEKQAKPAVD